MKPKVYNLSILPLIFSVILLNLNQGKAQSCPGLGSITLNVIAAPEPVITAPVELCAGANGTVGVTQTFTSYSWNTGASTQSIPVNSPGQFTVTVSNSAGCTGTASVAVAAAPPASTNIIQLPYACNGQITLDAGAGFSNYSWSNGGGGGPTATYSTAGNYTVTVTNAAGCTATDVFNVTIPAAPVVNITGNLIFCSDQSTTLNATAGFTQYNWSSGQNTASINITGAGPYTVTVTNSLGCTDTETVTVNTNPVPTPLVADNAACTGGSATLSISNAPFQSYNWSNSGTGSSITVGPGAYTVTVTAANGCTGTTSATINLLPSPNPNINQLAYACNSQISLDAGAGFNSYAWSNSSSNPVITVGTGGNYTVTVTNTQGCTGTDNFNVVIPTAPNVNITGDNSFCDGSSADLNASPGLTSYSWSTAQGGPSISVLNGGTYTVTATDNFGCTASASFSVTALASPAPNITGLASACEGINVVLGTSTTFAAYNWSNGFNTPTISVNASNTYLVTVTAVNGCTGTDSQLFSSIAAPVPVISEATYLCDEQITLVVLGGFTNYTWSNAGNSSNNTISTTGNYTVTVTNAQGCTGIRFLFCQYTNPASGEYQWNQCHLSR
jgi:hypothetical protein